VEVFELGLYRRKYKPPTNNSNTAQMLLAIFNILYSLATFSVYFRRRNENIDDSTIASKVYDSPQLLRNFWVENKAEL